MADDICDRVRLAGSGRTLNRYAGGALQTLHNRHLLVVIGQREKQLLDLAVATRRSAARQTPKSDWLKLKGFVGRLRNQRQRAFMDRAAVFEFFLQTLEVFEEKVDRPWSREHHPGVRYDEMGACGGSRTVLVQDFLVLAFTVEVAGDQFEDVRVAARIKRSRRPVLLSRKLGN